MTEKEYQARIIQVAKLAGWLVYHTHDSRRSEPGFPDLVLVRGRDTLFWELKTETGKVSPEQQQWLTALDRAGQDARVIRPADWPWVVQRLSRR